jgi:hypothetical protein
MPAITRQGNWQDYRGLQDGNAYSISVGQSHRAAVAMLGGKAIGCGHGWCDGVYGTVTVYFGGLLSVYRG